MPLEVSIMPKNKLFLLSILPLLISCGGNKDSSSSSFSSEEISQSNSEESSQTISISENSSESSSSSDDSSSSIYNELWDTSQDYLRTGSKEIDFYNINDLHGSIEKSSNEPGIAKISTYLANKKSYNPKGYVITSSGDMWQGSADSNITHGALIDEWMDYEGFGAMALGNHEFDWTIDRIIANQENTLTPFLACNIIYSETKENVDWVKPYTTITRNGVHIGIIGALGEGITTSILYNNVKGLSFDDPYQYVKQHSLFLKENGADIILYLYHESVFTIKDNIADYVDAIFGGHNHAIEKTSINGVPAVEGKSNGRYISHINLTYDFTTNSVSYGDYGYDDTNLLNVPDNPDVVAIKNKYADEIDQIKNAKIARIPNYLSSGEGVPHTYNRYAYRYYNDTYGEEDVYAVITNNGRASISSGVVTYGNIYKALPFDNYLTLFKASGKHIKEITSYSSSHWYIPSVSSNHISYDDAGQYFNDSEEYNVLCIDYISVSSYYESWMDHITIYMEESALPRNIFANYLAIEYPL